MMQTTVRLQREDFDAAAEQAADDLAGRGEITDAARRLSAEIGDGDAQALGFKVMQREFRVVGPDRA